MSNKAIVWIREDFRISDNPALAHASQQHDLVTALYIFNPKVFIKKREAQQWWLSKSLENFKTELSKLNINLEIQIGEEMDVLSKINPRDDLTIYWNKVYEPDVIKLGKKINVNAVTSKLSKVLKKKKSYEYFKNNKLPKEILPKKNWFKKFENYWDVSENKSQNLLNDLIKNKINNYGTNRDIPSVEGTSKLSPYIKHGQIHVEKIYKECSSVKPKNINIQKYINELGWREFSHSLINYFPEMLKGNLRKEFDKFPWVKNEKHLKAWKNGMTGYPIVDAGMRELYETGWMHNRIRMVVGSFLVKHLRINWVEGEKHFRNCLLDFNEANNVAQWQWVAGCGADAAPYFRIFNPILQGEKFDKEGLYVKKWVPELNKVPAKFIHKPWEMELKYQEAIKTIIGKDYPSPIVMHEKARVSALEAFQSLKNK